MSEYHDYKEMYLTMAREAEKAIQILIEAQQTCEELYLNAAKPSIQLLNSGNTPQKEDIPQSSP